MIQPAFMEKNWLFCFIAVFFMACSGMSTPPNITTDEFGLLALKASITFEPLNVLAHNWSITTSCCNWIGVTCGVHHRRVIALNLSYMDLTATIPPHLGNLSFLYSLSIRNNSFHGHLPHELRFLHRLKLIDLGVNNFGGGIPLWLGILPKLQILFLDNNGFSGSIPSSIFNISSLQRFSLSANSLSGILPGDMCNRLPNLKLLYLDHNQFYGKISSAIPKCKQLQYLVLSYNKFTGSIPKEIGNLTMLLELYLGSNNLEGGIPREIGDLINLEILEIQNSSLRGPIPSSIFNISSLKSMAFSINSLSGSLPKDICKHLPFLEGLRLSFNQFTGLIPSGLWGCSKLTVLSLSYNRFTGGIPKEIGNLTMIESLYLGFNNLKGEIPQEMGDLYNLKIIGLQNSSLSGSIPSKIFNISTMEVLSLTYNNLLGQLPSRIGLQLPNLKGLYLWGNKLGGVIPSSITNASKLTNLQLQDNSFTGFIPFTMGNLRLLEFFNVDNNFLTGEYSSTLELRFLTSLTNCKYLRLLTFSGNPLDGVLPISIGNFSTSLEYFNGPECQIKGRIPMEIGNVSNLIYLNLQENELIGSIPPTIGRLWKLQGLYLQGNKLQGSIPYDLCHLRSLVEMSLGGNELSGSVPTCLNNLTSLLYLYLYSNKLTSIITSTLWALTNILKLNLSENSLSGYLSPDIGNLKVAIVIDLSWNQLSGDIPSTIGGLQNLVNLSLAKNRLQGPIPQSFGDLLSIELLDLSKNNLSGALPKSLEALKYLKILNVSFNRLEGEIPNGGPFANFSAQSFAMNDALCGSPRLQVPPCKPGTIQQSRTIVKYILPAIACIVLIVAFIFVLLRCQKKNVRHSFEDGFSTLVWRRISYQELQRATDGFCEGNLLGTGSFGSVYKGILSDGMNVAIKVFNLQLEGAFKSFDAECEVLRGIRHRNLIKIISSCVNIDFKALILEYMPCGSLEKWLYSHNYCLDFLQRLNVMIDVASALEYLHHSYSTPVVHCDLKPDNVLLDSDMVAHVGDFGIAKLLGEEELKKETKTLATIGYMAPEYGSEGVVSTKGDLYSYGILMMETFTRKKPTDEMFGEEMSLKCWVKQSLPHAVIEVADANLLRRDEEHFVAKKNCISSLLELALDCSVELPEQRIDIKHVLAALNNIKAKFQISVEGTRNM